MGMSNDVDTFHGPCDRRLAKVEQQRDDLLAACKSLRAICKALRVDLMVILDGEIPGIVRNADPELAQADAAIAKVTEETY